VMLWIIPLAFSGFAFVLALFFAILTGQASANDEIGQVGIGLWLVGGATFAAIVLNGSAIGMVLS
jgi:hypothetical protein